MLNHSLTLGKHLIVLLSAENQSNAKITRLMEYSGIRQIAIEIIFRSEDSIKIKTPQHYRLNNGIIYDCDTSKFSLSISLMPLN